MQFCVSSAVLSSSRSRWDIRKLSECVEQMYLREKGSETNLGGVILEYDSAAGPTNFMVGTEQGHIFSCNRKAKNPADR